MIPLRDTIRSSNFPVVNTLLIVLNVLVYLEQMAQGPGLTRFIVTYGLVPARYTIPEMASYFTPAQQVFSFVSFMFLHGGFLHLLGNMWSLYIFGDNVEDRLGPARYLLFYLLCGFSSGVFHLFTNWNSEIPTIGASGAIAGVMGAYLILYPGSRILTLIPIFFIPYFIEIPAFFFLGLWFILQFLSAAASHGRTGGIAWWAHIGGFIAGIVLLKLFLKIPEFGITRKIRSATSRKKTPRLQVIRASSPPGDPHLYGNIVVSPKEARAGAHKLINVPWGFRGRTIRVTVPPGVRQGTLLRLAGIGKEIGPRKRGDILLRVEIRP